MPVTAGATSTEANLNDTTPAAPGGSINVKWQAGAPATDPNDPNFQVRDISAYIPAPIAQVDTPGVTIDGGGSPPTTGSKGFLRVPFNCTITAWSLVANASGSAQVTVKKCTDAAFPTTASIVASAPPALSSQQKAVSTTLTGWTTTLNAGDWLEFNLDSITTITRLTLQLSVTRS
jgi:hypothetical protein